MNFIIKHTGKISTRIKHISKIIIQHQKQEITPTAERIVDYTYKISSEVMEGRQRILDGLFRV